MGVGGGLREFPRRGRQKNLARPVSPYWQASHPRVLQALTFVIFICFTASISAYMAAALLEFFITLAFLFLYATQYYLRFDRLNWPCLVRDSAPPHSGPLLLEGEISLFPPSLSPFPGSVRGPAPTQLLRATLPLTEAPTPAQALPWPPGQPAPALPTSPWPRVLAPSPGCSAFTCIPSLAHSCSLYLFQVFHIVPRGLSM